MLFRRQTNLVTMLDHTHHVIDGAVTNIAVGISTPVARLLCILPRLRQVGPMSAREPLPPRTQERTHRQSP